MEHVWVVVADNRTARLFSTNKKGRLIEDRVLVHPRSRLKRADIITDRAGRYRDSAGSGHRSSLSSPTDPKQHEAEVFAHEVVDALEEGRNRQAFERIYVAAAPAMLGLMRALFSAPLQRLVAGELDKDLVLRRPEEIRKRLPERL